MSDRPAHSSRPPVPPEIAARAEALAAPASLPPAALSSGPPSTSSGPSSGPVSAPPSTFRRYEDLDGGQGREVFFRPQRYPLAELGPVRPVVAVDLTGGAPVECDLVDVSQNGVAFVAPAGLALEVGASIGELTVRFDDHPAYRGRAMVGSVRSAAGRTIVGASFVDSLMNVDDVLALRDVKSYGVAGAEGLGLASAPWRVAGHTTWKGLVAELRLFLEDARKRLGEVEATLPWHVVHGEPGSPARDALVARVHAEFVREFIERSEAIDVETRKAAPSERPALKEFSQRHLQDLFLEAPSMHRACFKPLGYPGDYEVMKYMYENQFAGPTLFARSMNLAILSTKPGDAVRFRKDLVRDWLARAIDEHDGSRPLRILSIAAGPAQEVYELLRQRDAIKGPVEVVLFDQDKGALAYAYSRISRVVSTRWAGVVHVTYLHDSIKRLLRDPAIFSRYGGFDVVFCCGLFDYLEIPMSASLAKNFYANVLPGGSVLIGNMTPWSQNRWFMELNLDWVLKYKTHEELLGIGRAGAPDADVRIVEEPTTINPFVVMTRP
jgi:extracellular factor (EF) 3-hydroxypalmitic acid methyl ester biosynthesis protein